MTDNESNFYGSMHLSQGTGSRPDGKDCVARTSIWLPKRISRNFMDCPFLCGFCAESGLEERKTSLPSNKAVITSFFCVDLIEQNGRHDNIRILEVEEMTGEDVYERVVEVANDIRVTTSKQHVSVWHRLPYRNPRFSPIIEEFVRRETIFQDMTYKRKLKNSSKKLTLMTI